MNATAQPQTPGPLATVVIEQYERALAMAHATIHDFPDVAWRGQPDQRYAPARIAYHLVECLASHAANWNADREFPWGSRFGGHHFAIPAHQLPSQADLLTWLAEAGADILAAIAAQSDAELLSPFEANDFAGETWLSAWIYAIRHTMHHQGELAALRHAAGAPGDSWK